MYYSKTQKNIVAILLAVLLVLSMSGCACQHDWKNWESSGNEMVRSCSKCKETETMPLDKAVLSKQFFVGSWYATALGYIDGAYMELDDESVVFECVFSEDSTFSMNFMGEILVGNWKTGLPGISHSAEFSTNAATQHAGRTLEFFSTDALGFDDDKMFLRLTDYNTETYFIFFERSEEPISIDTSTVQGSILTQENLIGTWSTFNTNDGQNIHTTIELKEDWTFSQETLSDGIGESKIISGVYEIFGQHILFYNDDNLICRMLTFENNVLVSGDYKFEKIK